MLCRLRRSYIARSGSDLREDGIAHCGTAEAGAALAHIIGGAQALVQHLVHRALDGVGLLGHAEGVP